MPIHYLTGKLDHNIYLVDSLQYGIHGIVSSFIYWDGKTCLLMDVGTSDNVANLISMLRKFDIPYNKIVGIVNSHYHFDHGGGSLNLWRRLVKKNPNFKIIVPQDMHDRLQDAASHMVSAQSTFGEFIGTMNPVEESAFKIVQKDVPLDLDLESNYRIQLIATPGHSADHVSPTVFEGTKPVFVHAGEAAGTLFHHKKLVSLPTSMPNYVNETYMASFAKLRQLDTNWVGFCHFGAIEGREDIATFYTEHLNYMDRFKAAILKAYAENPTTKYVYDQTGEFFTAEQFDPAMQGGSLGLGFLNRLRLALTYGMMVALGLRKPKYETVKG